MPGDLEVIMRDNSIIKNYADALAAGYRVSKPYNPTAQLEALCARLGSEYYLAIIDHGNVIHRVIGGGWDVEIYPRRPRSRYYSVNIWKGHGSQLVASENDVKDDGDTVKCMVEMMLHLYVPEEIYPTRYNIGPRPKRQ